MVVGFDRESSVATPPVEEFGLAEVRVEDYGCGDGCLVVFGNVCGSAVVSHRRSCRGGGERDRCRWSCISCSLHHAQYARPLEVPALGLHPSLANVDGALF